jgi:hypothetical protein
MDVSRYRTLAKSQLLELWIKYNSFEIKHKYVYLYRKTKQSECSIT